MPRMRRWPVSGFQLVQGLYQFVLAVAGQGFDGQTQHRFPGLDPLQPQGVGGVAEGVAGGGLAQSAKEHHLTGIGLFNMFASVGIDLEDPGHGLADYLAVRPGDIDP